MAMAPTVALAAAVAAGLPALASSASGSASPAFVPPSNLHNRRSARDGVAVSSLFATAPPPGKGDLYDDEELFDLLALHRALNPREEESSLGGSTVEDETPDEGSIAGGIHDWVLEALGEGGSGSGAESHLADGIGQNNGDSAKASPALPGLHELVLEAIEGIEGELAAKSHPACGMGPNGEPTDTASAVPELREPALGPIAPANQLAYDNLHALLRDKKPAVRAIATDVDGTLLAGRDLHPTTLTAALKAIDLSENKEAHTKIQHFFPATGKSRRGAVISLGPTLGPLLYKLPGVFIQGLYCVDGGGNVLFERKLPARTIRAAEELVRDCGISIVGYDGDDLYTTDRTGVVASLSEHYGEPTVEMLFDEDGSVKTLAEHAPGMHKLLLMDDDADMLAAVVRPRLEALAEERGAVVTQAIPTMLELLPAGCSKARGVSKVCEALGVDAARELLALGDAENDVEMLRQAAIGVAVGNACPRAKEAADFIMRERHDEGGAGLAMNLFAFDS